MIFYLLIDYGPPAFDPFAVIPPRPCFASMVSSAVMRVVCCMERKENGRERVGRTIASATHTTRSHIILLLCRSAPLVLGFDQIARWTLLPFFYQSESTCGLWFLLGCWLSRPASSLSLINSDMTCPRLWSVLARCQMVDLWLSSYGSVI